MSYSRVFRRRLWMMDSSSDSSDTLGSLESKESKNKTTIQLFQSIIVLPWTWMTNLFKTKTNTNALLLANTTLDAYLYLQTWVMYIGHELYQRYTSVQWVTTQTCHVYRWWRNVPSEPETTPWFNVVQLVYGNKTLTTRIDDQGQEYIDILYNMHIKEDYVMCQECNLPENLQDRWELVTQQQCREINVYDQVGTGAMWMYKESSSTNTSFDIYHIRIGYQGDMKMDMDMHYVKTPVRSSVRFISVEYKHPLMKHTIPLEIPISMMYVGNCLFFPAFVGRMLRYKCCEMYGGDHQPYVFDLDYTLCIMDKNLQYMELSSKQYLQLNTEQYEIVRGQNAF